MRGLGADSLHRRAEEEAPPVAEGVDVHAAAGREGLEQLPPAFRKKLKVCQLTSVYRRGLLKRHSENRSSLALEGGVLPAVV